jgi:hypothetical protein
VVSRAWASAGGLARASPPDQGDHLQAEAIDLLSQNLFRQFCRTSHRLRGGTSHGIPCPWAGSARCWTEMSSLTNIGPFPVLYQA